MNGLKDRHFSYLTHDVRALPDPGISEMSEIFMGFIGLSAPALLYKNYIRKIL